MTAAVLCRRMLRNGAILLFLAFLLGFPTAAGGPHGRQWMGAHLNTMVAAILVFVLGLTVPHFRLSNGQRYLLFITTVYSGYIGCALGVFTAVFGIPGPVTGNAPGIPAGWQGAVLGTGLAIIILSAFTFAGLAIYGLRSAPVGTLTVNQVNGNADR